MLTAYSDKTVYIKLNLYLNLITLALLPSRRRKSACPRVNHASPCQGTWHISATAIDSEAGLWSSYARTYHLHLPDLENSTPELEHTAAELFIQGKRIVFLSMYRPASCCKDNFKNNLSCTLDKIRQNAPALTIIGSDMNFGNNFEFYGSLKTTPFDLEATSILQQSCLNQIIDRSTHFAKTVNGHTASLLDHIWIERVDLVTKAVVFSPIIDHCGIGAVLDLLSPKPKVKTIQKYCFSEMTHQDLCNLKNHLQSFSAPDHLSSDDYCAALTSHLCLGLDKYFKKISYKPRVVDFLDICCLTK